MAKISQYTEGTPVSGDFVVFVDSSEGATKKADVSSLPISSSVTTALNLKMDESVYDPSGTARQVAFACTIQSAITDYTFTGTEPTSSGYLVTTASNRTVNINADLFTTGYEVIFCKGTDNTNTVTLDAGSGNNINGSQTYVLDKFNETVVLIKDGDSTWKIKAGNVPKSTLVQTTGNQTIAGNKTFTGAISASNLSNTNTGDETSGTIISKLGYTPANDSAVMKLTGNQSATGRKHFYNNDTFLGDGAKSYVNVGNLGTNQEVYLDARSDFYADVDVYVRAKGANGDINFVTNSLNRLFIKADGNVGIGTTSPTEKLQVNGNIKSQQLILRDDSLERHTGDDDNATIAFNYYGYNGGATRFRNASFFNGKGNLIFQTIGSTGKIRYIGDGTQGIGKVLTSDADGNATWQTPSGVGDMVKATYDPANKNKQLAADDEVVKLTGNQTVAGEKTFNNSIVSNQFIILRNDGDSVIFFQKDNGISRWALFKNSLQDFVLNRYDNSGAYVDNPLYVKGSNGNIGINETSPDYKLDVNGSFGFTPGIGTTITPVDNGDIVFEATSNTSLVIKMKGSDGVIRSTTLTLA